MALHEIEFMLNPVGDFETIPVEWSHNGVVGSGDMEVLMRSIDNGGAVHVKIVTPVTGYDEVWEKVLGKFIAESNIGNVAIEINDNNSTPYVVATRLRQGLLEARAGDNND